jgi:D-arabinose 1-dehydrogenase-like Zn-dependent alcohol dehydrogenase
MISCTSEKYRRAYGWQRDGGMAGYLLAEEKDLVALPDELSYTDGAQVACGFGTVYEGLMKIGISGNDSVLITGLGPVGLATGALCRKLGANRIIGIDVIDERLQLALDLGLCDEVLRSGPDNVAEVKKLTGGSGVERAIDCSANDQARATAIRATRKWGKIVMLGEGGRVEFNPSPDIIHDQKTIFGSWVTSIWLMEELVERLVTWKLHPADLVTHRFELEHVDQAYSLMASGRCGKVAVCFDEELVKLASEFLQATGGSVSQAAGLPYAKFYPGQACRVAYPGRPFRPINSGLYDHRARIADPAGAAPFTFPDLPMSVQPELGQDLIPGASTPAGDRWRWRLTFGLRGECGSEHRFCPEPVFPIRSIGTSVDQPQ